MTDDILHKVMEAFLPPEFFGYFDIVDIVTDRSFDVPVLNIHLDEKPIPLEGHPEAVPNGFYDVVSINDFPIRGKKTMLRVRRRRWKDADGHSFSRDWQLVAKGTRMSKEFAEFLKKCMDSSPIAASSLRPFYHIKANEFERAYKEHLSGFREWEQAGHAGEWLVFPENIGENLSLDESSLSDGEVYTFLSNKDAHGKKGSLVAVVRGTLAETVSACAR